jgi:hypothetical protein
MFSVVHPPSSDFPPFPLVRYPATGSPPRCVLQREAVSRILGLKTARLAPHDPFVAETPVFFPYFKRYRAVTGGPTN